MPHITLTEKYFCWSINVDFGPCHELPVTEVVVVILPQCSTQLLPSNFLLMITVAATLYPGDASTELKPMM